MDADAKWLNQNWFIPSHSTTVYTIQFYSIKYSSYISSEEKQSNTSLTAYIEFESGSYQSATSTPANSSSTTRLLPVSHFPTRPRSIMGRNSWQKKLSDVVLFWEGDWLAPSSKVHQLISGTYQPLAKSDQDTLKHTLSNIRKTPPKYPKTKESWVNPTLAQDHLNLSAPACPTSPKNTNFYDFQNIIIVKWPKITFSSKLNEL